MSLEYFLNVFVDNLIVLPSAFLCFLPMKNQLRFGAVKMTRVALPVIIVSLLLISWLTCFFQTGPNTVFFPLLILYFFLYHKCLKVHISKSLAIFTLVCVLMALVGNFSIIYDAILHPSSGADSFSMDGALFQLGFGLLLTVVFFYPMQKYGSVLIDNLNLPKVWFTTVLLSGIFLAVNIIIRPLHYQTLYTNNVFLAFVIVLTMMFVTMLLLTITFYFIVSGMIREMEINERNRLLEMQESQFIKQQRYMERSAAARHDFRQTIRALEKLAEGEDYDAIRDFITEYAGSMPVSDVISFCPNHAVNALLNYYHEAAESSHIDMKWEIKLPESVSIPQSDLCSIIGNLLENAITACSQVPEEDRYIDLSVATTDSDAYLCIVMTNPYAGSLRKKESRYLSTRKDGSGIGLSSVASTVAQYGGVARFSDEDGEFYSDIMMRMG